MAVRPDTRSPFTWRRESILDLYQFALGVFLFVSPWLFSLTHGTARAELIASSIAIMAISAVALIAFAEWEEWLNLLLGVWLIVAPWVLGFTHTSGMHVSVGVGLIVAYLALLELWLVHDPEIVETPEEAPRAQPPWIAKH